MAIAAERATSFLQGESRAPLAEAIGGIATIVLAILGLANVAEGYLVPIVAILFGAVMLIYGTNIALALSEVAAHSRSLGTGPSAVLLAGAAGIVLGILALLGMHANTLIPASVIVYGAAMMLSGSASLQLQALGSQQTGEHASGEMFAGGAGVQTLGGLVAIVLGLLSLTGGNSPVLVMVAFLVLGSMIVISRAALTITAR
jgi:hypothetical protein